MNTATKKTTGKGAAEGAGKPQSSGLGLDSMGDLSALLDAPTASANGGGPLLLEMDLIDEDPHQPRTEDNPGFSNESLEELSASIKLRGVKTPISVRDNSDAPGRYIINHGARRFRGRVPGAHRETAARRGRPVPRRRRRRAASGRKTTDRTCPPIPPKGSSRPPISWSGSFTPIHD